MVKVQKEAAIGGVHLHALVFQGSTRGTYAHLNDSTPDRPSVSEKASSSRGKAGGCSGVVVVVSAPPEAAGALMLGAVR